MNTLTVNLHLMRISFYQPTATRHKILLAVHAFPSDHYAVSLQIKFHDYDLDPSMSLAKTRENEERLRREDILHLIENNKDSLAMILLLGAQYYTGQFLNIKKITAQEKKHDITIGWGLAHAAGNVPLSLHDWGVDFAAWCNYKYLNSGPGSVASCFIHKRHHLNTELPRFNGWWGDDKKNRFLMNNQFDAANSADTGQLSNPPVLSLAAICASLDTITEADGITGDWREPNVIRIAPTALYNSHADCYHFVAIRKQQLETQ